jgi:hypothetical protein
MKSIQIHGVLRLAVGTDEDVIECFEYGIMLDLPVAIVEKLNADTTGVLKHVLSKIVQDIDPTAGSSILYDNDCDFPKERARFLKQITSEIISKKLGDS